MLRSLFYIKNNFVLFSRAVPIPQIIILIKNDI